MGKEEEEEVGKEEEEEVLDEEEMEEVVGEGRGGGIVSEYCPYHNCGALNDVSKHNLTTLEVVKQITIVSPLTHM